MNDNNFSSPFTPTLAGKKHFFRAYAIQPRVISSERRKLLSLPQFPDPVIGRMQKRALPVQTGGKVRGLVHTMHPIPINGLCIRNLAGFSQAQVWRQGSGFGRMDYNGYGPIQKPFLSSIPLIRDHGFIFT